MTSQFSSDMVFRRLVIFLSRDCRQHLSNLAYFFETKIHDVRTSLCKSEIIAIKIHSERERSAAERMAKKLKRFKKDRDVSYELFKPLKWHDRYSVYITNLSDPEDKELKKALVRRNRGYPRKTGRWEDDYGF